MEEQEEEKDENQRHRELRIKGYPNSAAPRQLIQPETFDFQMIMYWKGSSPCYVVASMLELPLSF